MVNDTPRQYYDGLRPKSDYDADHEYEYQKVYVAAKIARRACSRCRSIQNCIWSGRAGDLTSSSMPFAARFSKFDHLYLLYNTRCSGCRKHVSLNDVSSYCKTHISHSRLLNFKLLFKIHASSISTPTRSEYILCVLTHKSGYLV